MDQDAAVIRAQINETRAALAEKLKLLQDRLCDTVRDTQADVESVRATVNESIQTVRRALDVNHQFRQHPWLTLGACVLAGFALANHQKRRGVGSQGPKPAIPEASPASGAPSAPAMPRPKNSLHDQFQEEIDMVKGMVIGVAVGYLRDAAKQALPQLAPQIQEIMDSATVKLGGTPIAGPLITPSSHSQAPGQPGSPEQPS